MATKKPTSKTFHLVNLNGGMNTVAEENALLSLDPNARYGTGFTTIRTEFRNADNFVPIYRGGLSKSYGHSLFFNTGVASVLTGLYRFKRSGGTNHFMYSQGTGIYTLAAGVSTIVASLTITSGAYPSFETARDYLIVCDGTISPLKSDGTTVSALGGSPPAAAKQSLFYQNRLFIFAENTSVIQYSDATSIESGYGSNIINCDVNDGQKVTGMCKFFIPGELAPVILVSKDRSFGIITGDGTASNPFTFQKLTPFGCLGFRQIIQTGDDAAFLTPRGVNTYRTATQNKNLESEILSKNVADQFTGLSQTYLDKAFCREDWKRRRISFAVPHSSSVYPNRIWHYDLEQGGWYKQTGFNLTCVFVDTDGTVYFGDDTGKIMEEDPTVHNYNGSAIIGTLSTAFMDFFEPDYDKQIEWAKVIFRGQGSYTLGCSTRHNYGSSYGSTHTINLASGAYLWSGGNWTSDAEVYQWGAAALKQAFFYPKGIFKSLQFTFNQTGEDQPVDIFGISCKVNYLNSY